MRSFSKIFWALIAVLCLQVASPAFAEDAKFGTKEEAVALVEKAVVAYKENPEKAIAAFNDPKGGFIDRDLYIFVIGDDGLFVANGGKPAMVGKTGLEITDVNGFKMVPAFLEIKQTGWVDYKWVNPIDKKPHDKSSYIVREGNRIIGCGYYKG